MTKLTFGRYSFETSNEDKILLPTNISKKDILDYYDKISDLMLPYLKNRPLMMQRLSGEGKEISTFYQKNRPEYFPTWIQSENIKIISTVSDYVLCQNKATLLYLANQGCITFHTWLSKYPKVEYPDKLIFDLDPSTNDFEPIRKTAFIIKDILEDHKLHPFIMTTGSKGLHVVVPLKATQTFSEVKDFAKRIAIYLSQEYPDDLTIELNKQKREKRLFVDYLRNELGATAVAPYSIRPIKNAPVATPILWEELKDKKLISQTYNINNIDSRLKTNPWEDFKSFAKKLPEFKY